MVRVNSTHTAGTPSAPGSSSRSDSPQGAPRGQITAWAMWEWGSAAFNAVIVTFVFSVYLTNSVGRDLGGPLTAATGRAIP